mgnify:CR=1 FL=1
MESYRKRLIGQLLTRTGEIIQSNPDISISQIMVTVLRPKNMKGDSKDPFFMTDEDFSSALETTLDDLKDMSDEQQ